MDEESLTKKFGAMDKIVRFGVSMEESLLKKFDSLIERKGYYNRSEAIRDIIREKLAEETIKREGEIVFGVLSFVYDHNKKELEEKITDFQHENFKNIVFASHVHIDKDNCLEIVIMKGEVRKLKEITDMLLSFIGVKHGKLSLIPAGKVF